MKLHKTNTACSNAARFLAALSGCIAGASALAQDWYWTGGYSSDWSVMSNWNKTADGSGLAPASVAEFANKNLMLTEGGMFPPSNQDIPNLALNILYITNAVPSFTISGAPIQFKSIYIPNDSPAQSITIYNDLILDSSNGWRVPSKTKIFIYGTVSETAGGSKSFSANENGNIHFFNTVSFTGGFRNNQAHAHLYGIHTFGALPSTFMADYFRSGNGSLNFHSPDGNPYDYVLDENVGFTTSGGGAVISIDGGVSVSMKGMIGQASMGNKLIKNGDGPLFLDAPDILQTRLDVNRIVVLNASQTAETMYEMPIAQGGNIELNGHDLIGYSFSFSNGGGVENSGCIRNSNLERESRVSGRFSSMGSNNDARQFGGPGNITFDGVLDPTSNRGVNFRKVGPGVLTFTGVSTDHTGNTDMNNGTLVLDYAATNANKAADSGNVILSGGLRLLGNETADTIEIINNLQIIGANPLSQAFVSAQGRGGRAAELRAASMTFTGNTDFALDIAVGAGGAIKFADGANNAAGIINSGVTFAGESFAIYGATGADGFKPIEPLDSSHYVPGFDTGTNVEFIDIVGAVVNTTADTAAALRFNSPGSSFTTDANINLRNGAILVTPNSGTEPIVIDGNGDLVPVGDGKLYIHQYNTNAPLVIKNRIFNNAAVNALVKSGPGELVLHKTEGVTNVFAYARILAGTLTTDEITDIEKYSASGRMRDTVMIGNNAALKYSGPAATGATANIVLSLAGSATLDASGSGPLTLTNATVATSNHGCCGILTLAGNGEGETRGKLDLREGGIIKTGPGVWTLSGGSAVTNSFFCGAVVEEGTLAVDCALGKDVIVKANGTLAGTGFITRHLRFSGGALAIDTDAAAAGNVLTVAGNIVLDNAQLVVKGRFPMNVPVEILKTNVKITGEFANVPDKYRLEYSENSIVVTEIPLGTMLIVR